MAQHLHPFPARMAPDLALDAVRSLRAPSRVLDPMCGSGTAILTAAREGHDSIGFDLDPLAVLIARTGAHNLPRQTLLDAASAVLQQASKLTADELHLPWIDDDDETVRYVNYWFGEPQRSDLRRLAVQLHRRRGPVADVLRLALSKIIVTKDRGASLGRDVSHSRPHKVADASTFDVFRGYRLACERLADLLDENHIEGATQVVRGDARRLPRSIEQSADLVITSPPYLNGIDYMRGHRLSLVWLGHRVSDLRRVRATSIGAERSPDQRNTEVGPILTDLASFHDLSPQVQGMLYRFGDDMLQVVRQIRRALKPNGRAVLVVGDSFVRGVYIANSTVVMKLAQLEGLRLLRRVERSLPPDSRYLPPPNANVGTALSKRLRSEVVLTFAAS